MPDTHATAHACGYGRAALDALSAVVADAKAADPLAPVTIVAPNTVAGIVARRHLASGIGGRAGVAGLAVTTLDRLAEQVAAPLLSPAKPATAPLVAAAWRTALAHNPGLFAPVADHPATIRALARAHRELRDLDPAGDPVDGSTAAGASSALDRIAGSGPLGADLVALHRRVRAAVHQRCYDGTDLLLAAAGALPGGSDAGQALGNAAEWGTVVLYLPQELTLAQSRFARAIAAHAPTAVVVGLTGVQRADAAVLRTLRRLGLPEPTLSPRPPTATRLRHASDSDAEVRGAVRQVMATLTSTPAHRIAVLYAAQVPYARALHEQFAQAGITVNGPGTVPVAERAIARGLLAILELAGTDLPRAELFRALAEAPTRDADGERIPLSRWERTSRLAGVVGGDDWTVRLDAYADAQRTLIDAENASDDPSPGRIDGAERQIDSSTGLRDFAIGLRALLDEGAALADWGELSAWALRLLHTLYRGEEGFAGLPAAELYAAVAVEQALSGLAGLAALEPVTSLPTLRETLALTLESALPRVGQFGDGVFVAPLSAAVGLDADEVLVLGLAEDLYPGRMHPDPLLPDEVREVTGEALPRTRDRLDAGQRHLLAALLAAPSVTASFPRGDLRRSTTRLPTRWLLPTVRELAGDTELAATEWESATAPGIAGEPSHAAALLRTPEPATEQEWRIRAVAADGWPPGTAAHIGAAPAAGTDAVIAAGLAMNRGRSVDEFTRFDGNLAGAVDLPDLAGGIRRISPTALESYATCPHAYFVHRMLRVEPLQQPEQTITISPLDIGNLIHRSMDELVRRCGDDLPSYGEPWTGAQRDLLLHIAGDLAQEYQRSGATGHPRLWQQERRRILDDLHAMLDDDNTWRAELDAAVVASELTFGKDGAEPVAIPLPDGGRVLMVGSADKVDRTRSGTLLVTDIKTGSSRGYQAISEQDPVAGGTRLQLPVYAHAARQLLGGTEVRAQYWFVRRNRGERVPLPLTDEVETVYADTLRTLVGSISAGLFPAKAPEVDDFAWVQCPYCNPDGVGHRSVRRRWERKRSDPVLAELVALIDPDSDDHDDGDDAGSAETNRAASGGDGHDGKDHGGDGARGGRT